MADKWWVPRCFLFLALKLFLRLTSVGWLNRSGCGLWGVWTSFLTKEHLMECNSVSWLGMIYGHSLLHLTAGVLDENFRVKCLNTDASPGWVKSSSDDLNQLGMEEYGQRALNDTISSYSYVEHGCFWSKMENKCQNWKKQQKKIYLLSSGIKASLLVNLFQEWSH